MLVVYACVGVTMLLFVDARQLLEVSTMIYNYALGFSSFHVLVINTVLLPRECRPSRWIRLCLFLGGVFFTIIAVMSTLAKLQEWKVIDWF
jgi:hypothetical protein